MASPDVAVKDRAGSAVTQGRLMSLDIFRGATIAAMILVNDPGGPGTYWPLEHAEWNGWTPTDLVFPFFLFIVGVAMAFSFPSRLKRGESRQNLLLHVAWRGVILFVLGVFLNGLPIGFHLASWRVYGVLQRIAICYVIAAIVALRTKPRTWLAAAVGCLAGYWILMRFIPVPGYGVPAHDIPLLDPDRNLVAWLDRTLLTGHLSEVTRDPEGLLSSIPAVASCLFGLLTGHWLRSSRTAAQKVRGLVISGCSGVVLGEIWNVWFPINKKLWTSSYVLLTTGLALLVLALCYWLMDIKQRRGPIASFFQIFGSNAIAAYVLAELLAIGMDMVQVSRDVSVHDFVHQRFLAPIANAPNSSLLYAIAFALVCWIPMWLLYRKRIFLKI